MSHHRLAIHPAPFKPSRLSIPPSPFSPLSPLTPASTPQKHPRTTELSTSTTPAPPAPNTPLQWVWTCHTCTRAYPLGATRRCLDDGHYFCAGTTTVQLWRKGSRTRKTRRHKACASEFDYLGWKGWGRWKRACLKPVKILQSDANKNCWTQCDYPSQCRWGKIVGIHTPTPTQTAFDVPSFGASVLHTSIAELPTLDECFASSPPSEFGVGSGLEAGAKMEDLGSTTPTSTCSLSTCLAQTRESSQVHMLDADAILSMPSTPSTMDIACIDPALLALTDPSHTSLAHTPLAPATSNQQSSMVDGTRNLLFGHRATSRRQIDFSSVSNMRRKNRRGYGLLRLTLQEPLTRVESPRVDGDVFGRCSALERVERGNESAVNVG